MSVEKFNPSIKGETVPYLQANRNVVQNIKNPEALAVWIYLLSLPADWNIIKEHIQKHFRIGQDKLKKIFSYLNRVHLIEYVKNRRSDGTLATTEIIVLNGSKFNDGTEDLSTETTTGVKTTPLENHTCGFELLHIKQNTNKIFNKKSFCKKNQKSKAELKKENSQKHEFARSMNQMAREKKHIEEHENRKKAEKKTGLPDYLKGMLNNNTNLFL